MNAYKDRESVLAPFPEHPVFAREASVANRESLERTFASRTYYQGWLYEFSIWVVELTCLVKFGSQAFWVGPKILLTLRSPMKLFCSCCRQQVTGKLLS